MYTLKPFEAFRLGFDDMPAWFTTTISKTSHPVESLPGFLSKHDGAFILITNDGEQTAFHGDYIIKDGNRNIFPVKAAVFQSLFAEQTVAPPTKIRCLMDVAVEEDSPCYYCCVHCDNHKCSQRCQKSFNKQKDILIICDDAVEV